MLVLATTGLPQPVAADPLSQPPTQAAMGAPPAGGSWTGSFAYASAHTRAIGTVRLLRAVPEPSSLLLVVVGLLAVAWTRRRSLRRWDGALRRRAGAARAKLAALARAVPRRASRHRNVRTRTRGAPPPHSAASGHGLHEIGTTQPPQRTG